MRPSEVLSPYSLLGQTKELMLLNVQVQLLMFRHHCYILPLAVASVIPNQAGKPDSGKEAEVSLSCGWRLGGQWTGTSLRKAASVGAVRRYNALYGPLPSLEIAQAVAVALPGTFPTPRLLSLWAQPCAISMRWPCLDTAILKCLL